MDTSSSYTSIQQYAHIIHIMMPHIRIIRCNALLVILLSLYHLIHVYQQLHTQQPQSNSTVSTHTNITTISSLLIVSTAPSQLIAIDAFPALNMLSPVYSNLHTIYVWILASTVEQYKSQFIANLHNYYKLSVDIVFINDYVPQDQHTSAEQWLRNSHFYVDNLDMILLHASNHQIQPVLVQLVRQSQQFTIQQQSATILAVRNPIIVEKNQQCASAFDHIIAHTAVAQVSADTKEDLKNLVFSPKIKMVQPLHITVSTASLPSWLKTENITTIYVSQMQQDQEEAFIQIILILALKNTNLKFLVHSKQWQKKILLNLLLNNLSAQVELFLAQETTIWSLKGVAGFYSLASFERQLDRLRTRIISNKSKIIIIARDEGYNLINIRNEFAVVRIEDKVHKEENKKNTLNNMLALYVIEKAQRKKQINNIEKSLQAREYTFVEGSLTPSWYKNTKLSYELSHCFSQKSAKFREYFIGESNKEKYTSVIQFSQSANIKNVLWCWEGEYQFFYYLVRHAQFSIILCDSITGQSTSKLKKIAVLNDFSGKINKKSEQPYSLVLIQQEHRQMIKSSFTYQYKFLIKNKQICEGEKLDLYCLQDP